MKMANIDAELQFMFTKMRVRMQGLIAWKHVSLSVYIRTYLDNVLESNCVPTPL